MESYLHPRVLDVEAMQVKPHKAHKGAFQKYKPLPSLQLKITHFSKVGYQAKTDHGSSKDSAIYQLGDLCKLLHL